MRSIKIILGIFVMSLVSFSCEPEALPDNQPEMDDTIINLEKSASGNESNPIDDDKSDD